MNQYGKDYRILIGDGQAGTEGFDPIGGETTLRWGRSSEEFDLSDKDSGVYGSASYGQQTITFDVSGNLKLPDDGLERASDVSKSSPPEVNIKVMKGAVVKFHGMVAIGNFSADFPTKGPATYSFQMKNKGAPIVDDLGASA
ncbi:phage tail tube protein [Roseisolibacter sp. H3M3-2]|uniref:phage tail tube protein n=1 Tax=Roseisolibacter sp. H3M3-2 TaxID=3031323 RepID=UPI0023D9ACFB|nr:phage tail tube protein [Roseisolibacter sp. H3M3-2]MDF1506264.1 phage tail tube protein [Roseisolibacter sp. H3M3-2]